MCLPATVHTVPSLGEVSSSQARAIMDEDVLSEIVGERIASYIATNKLYAFSGAEQSKESQPNGAP